MIWLQTTGLTGLAVATNPHHTLGALYGKILRTLQKMPESSVYRKFTEQIVRERAAVLSSVCIKLMLNIICYYDILIASGAS